MTPNKLYETRFLRMPDVRARTGASRGTVYRWIGMGEFPRPVRIGPNTSAWVAAEIDTWVNKRIAARDAQGGGGDAA